MLGKNESLRFENITTMALNQYKQGKKTGFTFFLPDMLHQELKSMAKEERISMSSYVSYLLLLSMSDKKSDSEKKASGNESAGEALRAALEEVGLPEKDAENLFCRLKIIFEQLADSKGLDLYKEMAEMVRFINETKKSLREFNVAEITDEDLPATSDQLEGIVEATEEATDKILTATENMLADQDIISEELKKLKALLDKERGTDGWSDSLQIFETIAKKNRSALMSLFEACNFQDLTGQRIQKIVGLVQGIEAKIMKMVIAFDLKRKSSDPDVDPRKIEEGKKMLEHYEAVPLQGPQKKGEGVTQSDVDDLLGDLGF